MHCELGLQKQSAVLGKRRLKLSEGGMTVTRNHGMAYLVELEESL